MFSQIIRRNRNRISKLNTPNIISNATKEVGINSLEFAKVQVLNMQKGAITDEKGFFRIDGLEPGVY